jgi:hypothetical protein
MLGKDVTKEGWVLYSGLDTLKPGSYYLMGFNPREDDANRSLLETTHHADDWSAYTQQCWKEGCKPPRCQHMDPMGRLTEFEPHQRNVKALADLLDRKPECIFSANAIFVQSPTAKDLENADELWHKCWQVHQKFLALVRPKWIICLGNGGYRSSFQLLRQKAIEPVPNVCILGRPDFPPSYRNGKCFEASFDLGATALRVKVLGVPHPSRFPINSCLKEFIAKNLTSSALIGENQHDGSLAGPPFCTTPDLGGPTLTPSRVLSPGSNKSLPSCVPW